jgi:hypothetical protein
MGMVSSETALERLRPQLSDERTGMLVELLLERGAAKDTALWNLEQDLWHETVHRLLFADWEQVDGLWRVRAEEPGFAADWVLLLHLALMVESPHYPYDDQAQSQAIVEQLSTEPAFNLGKTMAECRRILIIAPETFQDLLVAMPVIQAIVHEVKDVVVQLLAGPQEAAFLAAIFGRDRVWALDADQFFLGEAHFRALLQSVQTFRPDLTINLRLHSQPLLHFLVRSSLAPLRAQVSGDAPRPFANITLLPGEKPNQLRRYLSALRLWEATGEPLPCKWMRLTPSKENLEKAAALLASKHLKPDKTRLFIWQNQGEKEQSTLVREGAARAKREGKSLAVVHGQGSLPGAAVPTPHVAAEFPTFGVETPGLLLALFARSAVVAGMNGPLLHLAGLCETDVEASFLPGDEPYDTAFLNPRMTVKYLTGTPPASSPSAPA